MCNAMAVTRLPFVLVHRRTLHEPHYQVHISLPIHLRFFGRHKKTFIVVSKYNFGESAMVS